MLKKKREEEWALAKKQDLEATKKKINAENRKLDFNRAKQYSKEYEQQVCISHLYLYLVNTGVLCFDDSLIIEYLFGLFRRRN